MLNQWNQQFMKTVVSILLPIMLTLSLQSCSGLKSTGVLSSKKSGPSEPNSPPYVNRLESAAQVQAFGLEKSSEFEGRRLVFYTMIFVVETGPNGKIYFQKSQSIEGPVDSYHTKLLQSIPHYESLNYFDLISGSTKQLSAGYLYIKTDATGAAISPIGVELVLLRNGQNIPEPEGILSRKGEIKHVLQRLSSEIGFADKIVYTKADLAPQFMNDLKEGLEQQASIEYVEFAKLVGTRNPVYTAGTSYGYLKNVSIDDANHGSYTFRDILTLNQLPLEISPISGIISSIPQSPLSHVTMKTDQLGVPNIYIEKPETVEKIEKYIDKPDGNNLVELRVHKNGSFKISGTGTFHTKDIPGLLLRGRANRFWQKLRPQNLPEIRLDLDQRELLTWRGKTMTRDMIGAYGAKGVNFARLDNLLWENEKKERKLFENSFLIPMAFYQNHVNRPLTEALCLKGEKRCLKKSGADCTIVFNHCTSFLDKTIDDFIQSNVTGSTLENMRGDPNSRRKRLSFIRGIVRSAKVPAADLALIKENLARHPANRRFRLRSSTNAEDLPGINGAGLYDSKSACLADDAPNNADTEGSACMTPFERERKIALIEELSRLENPPEELIKDFRKDLTKKKSTSKSLAKVFASLWNDSAFNDREFFGIDHMKVKMGVLAHPSFIDETANGVAVVSESEGQTGYKISVSVQIEDVSVTNPDIPGAKPDHFSIRLDGSGISEPTYLLNSNRTSGNPVLKNEQIRELIDQLVLIHKDQKDVLQEDFTGKTDLEFKFDINGKVLIKQARPL